LKTKTLAVVASGDQAKHMRFLMRWIMAFALLAATFNPTGQDYVRWSMAQYDSQTGLVLGLGAVLLVGHVIFLRATLRSIGVYGFVLGLAVIGTLIWLLADQGLMSLQNSVTNTWLALGALSLMLAIGQSWADLRDRLAEPDELHDPDDPDE
jgi:hypothetical protein